MTTRERGNAANGHAARSAEGHYDVESHQQQPLKRSAVRALIQDFEPFWFTWSMNSGILGILCYTLPYQFRGLEVLSTIFFFIDLILFVVFSVIFIARFVIYRGAAYEEATSDATTLGFFGCWGIAYITLPVLIALIVSHEPWGGYNWMLCAYSLWWIGVAFTFATLFFVFIVYIRRSPPKMQPMPFTAILPAVAASTLALAGALITVHGEGMTPRLAVPVIIVGFLANGIGLILGLYLISFLFHQLLMQSFPPPESTTMLFLLVGPMGQCAAAFQVLGSSASTYKNFANYNRGTFITMEGAQGLEAACTLFALLLTGMGAVWLAFALYAMLERAVCGQLKWSPKWNSIIFPTATLTTSCVQFSIQMDSPAWRVVATGLIIFLVLVYLVNVVGTVYKISKGEVLIVREDPRVRRKMEEEEKGR